MDQAMVVRREEGSLNIKMSSTIPIKTGICIYDNAQNIVSWNLSATEILGYSASEILGRPVRSVFPMLDSLQGQHLYNILASSGEMMHLVVERSDMLGPDSRELYVLAFSNYTEMTTLMDVGKGELHRDEISGLYDGDSITEILSNETKRALRYRQSLSVLVVKINDFDEMDALHGPGGIELIVQTLAIILKNETRDVDCIGRLNDDMFVVGLPSTHLQASQKVAARIAKVAQHYSDDVTPFTVSVASVAIDEPVADWRQWLKALIA